MSGVDGDTGYLVHTNLTGAYNCLELARRDRRLHRLPLDQPRLPGRSRRSELRWRRPRPASSSPPSSPSAASRRPGSPRTSRSSGARTLYGATKLAAELLIEEYRAALRRAARSIDRCGVIAGPWQMGKVDQGVFTHWMLAHHFGNPLSYIGFGGDGKQVRDLLHVEDLVDLVERQLLDPEELGRPHRQRRRRPRVQPLAAGDDGDLPGADRQRGADRRRSPRRARATCRSTSPTARASSSWTSGAPAQRRAGARRHPRWIAADAERIAAALEV